MRMTGMTFSEAMNALKQGFPVRHPDGRHWMPGDELYTFTRDELEREDWQIVIVNSIKSLLTPTTPHTATFCRLRWRNRESAYWHNNEIVMLTRSGDGIVQRPENLVGDDWYILDDGAKK